MISKDLNRDPDPQTPLAEYFNTVYVPARLPTHRGVAVKQYGLQWRNLELIFAPARPYVRPDRRSHLEFPGGPRQGAKSCNRRHLSKLYSCGLEVRCRNVARRRLSERAGDFLLQER